MALKGRWEIETPVPEAVPLSIAAEADVARAARLARDEIIRLDSAERHHAAIRLVAWDILRDQLRDDANRSMSVSARERGGAR